MPSSGKHSGGLAVALPVLAVVVSTACFQFGAALAKGLYPAIGPVGAAALRLFFGAIILLMIMRPWRNWPASPPWRALVALGVCTAGAILFYYLAIERLPLGVAISIQSLGPLTVAALKANRPSHGLWVLLAGLGIWCLVGSEDFSGGIDTIGLIYALVAAVSWGGYIIVGHRAAQGFGASGAAISLAVAALVVMPFAIQQSGMALFALDVLPLALLVAIIAGALPFSLELYALFRIPARKFAILTSLEPVFAVLAGALMLSEFLTFRQILGVAMVVAASMGAVAGGTRKQPS